MAVVVRELFRHLQEYVEFLEVPNTRPEELRQKQKLAEDLLRVLALEEDRLASGHPLNKPEYFDTMLLGGLAPQKPPARPATAFTSPGDRPVLRRERTFDMEPSKAPVVVTDIGLDYDDEDRQKRIKRNEKLLHLFRQERELCVYQVRRQMANLANLEQELLRGQATAMTSNGTATVVVRRRRTATTTTGEVPPSATPRPVPRPRTMFSVSSPQDPALPTVAPRRPSRKRDADSVLTTLADSAGQDGPSAHFSLKVSHSADTCAWFIPKEANPAEEEEVCEEEASAGDSLLKHYLHRSVSKFFSATVLMRNTKSK
jgi:hypothetical protein